MEKLILTLDQILQPTYFRVNPFNPNNTEDNYQEVLRQNISLIVKRQIGSEITVQKSAKDILGEEIPLKNKTERYDLTMDNILFELKNVEKLEKNS